MFRKKDKPREKKKSTKRALLEEQIDEAEDEIQREDLMLVQAEHKLRLQQHRQNQLVVKKVKVDAGSGLSHDKSLKKETASRGDIEVAADFIADDGVTKTQSSIKMLAGQFTTETSRKDRDLHENIMNDYVESRLTKDNPDKIKEGSTEEKMEVSEEDRLYHMPDHLKVESSLLLKDGPLSWSTGIAEVELPDSFVKSNVNRTKQALEQAKIEAKRRQISSALPSNFSANFRKHQTDYVEGMRSKDKETRIAANFHKVDRNKPADDITMKRFIRTQRRR